MVKKRQNLANVVCEQPLVDFGTKLTRFKEILMNLKCRANKNKAHIYKINGFKNNLKMSPVIFLQENNL